MNLLSKKKLDAEINKERKSQIDEGMTLAKKVDDIRDTYLREQQQLADFRKRAVEEANEIALQAKQQKERLQQEIDGLLETRSSAIEPLNMEWDKVNDAIVALQEQTTALIQEKSDIALQKDVNLAKEKEINAREKAILSMERKSALKASALADRETSVKNNENEANERIESVESIISESYRMLDKRASEIGEKLVNIEFREAYLKTWEEKLINKQKKVNSDAAANTIAMDAIRKKQQS